MGNAKRRAVVSVVALLLLTAATAGAVDGQAPQEVGPNLVVNGGFEEGAEGWRSTTKIVDDPVFAGQHAARIDSTVQEKGNYTAQSFVPIKPNTYYTFSGAFRRTTGAGYVYVHCNWYKAPGERLMSSAQWSAGRAVPVTLRTGEGTGQWREMSGVFRCQRADVGGLQLVIFIRGGKDVVYLDEISIRELHYPDAPAWEFPNAVIFPGHPSRFGMAVEGASADGQTFTVNTTGAEYVLDAAAGTMSCRQRAGMWRRGAGREAGRRIGAEREVATVRFSEALGEMNVVRQDEEVCVVAGEEVAFGFQGDSLVTIATNRDLKLSVTSRISANWFRKQEPFFLAIDEQGGFCVTPYARPELNTPGTSMSGPEEDTSEPGWQVDYEVGEREMFALAVFPPKPFDWEKSFKRRIVGTSGCPDPDALREYSKHANVLFMFAGIYQEHYAGYCHAPYTVKEDEPLRETIALAHELGMQVIIYRHPTSYGWAGLTDEDFLADIKAFREEWGFDGWYFDGYPGWSSWMNAYRCMRIVRDRVGEGTIYVHCTLNPPIRMTELYCPFIDAYADFLLRAEAQVINGPADPYLRYVVNTQNISNAIATIKANKMIAEALPADATREQIDEAPKASLRLQLETMLKLNGRCRWAYPGWPLRDSDKEDYIGFYFAELDKMQSQWEETGEALPMTWP